MFGMEIEASKVFRVREGERDRENCQGVDVDYRAISRSGIRWDEIGCCHELSLHIGSITGLRKCLVSLERRLEKKSVLCRVPFNVMMVSR